MKFHLYCVFALLISLQGCSTNKSNPSSHVCLVIASDLQKLTTSNVAGISLQMPNNLGSVYFEVNDGQMKAICSSENFQITTNGVVSSKPEQDIYYFQSTENELREAQKSASGYWYSTLGPKNKNEWLDVVVSTNTQVLSGQTKHVKYSDGSRESFITELNLNNCNFNVSSTNLAGDSQVLIAFSERKFAAKSVSMKSNKEGTCTLDLIRGRSVR